MAPLTTNPSKSSSLRVPISPETPAPKVDAFLKALNALPGSPCICPKIVTFSSKAHKRNWEVCKWGQLHATYSLQSCLWMVQPNRLFYFCHPPGTWVGSQEDWKTEAWHSWAIALIRPENETGTTMVIYDSNCITHEELAADGKPRDIKSLTLHRSYLEYWQKELHRDIQRFTIIRTWIDVIKTDVLCSAWHGSK